MLIFVDFISHFFWPNRILQYNFSWEHGSLDKILPRQSEDHGNILTVLSQDCSKILTRSCQDLTKISMEGQPGKSCTNTLHLRLLQLNLKTNQPHYRHDRYVRTLCFLNCLSDLITASQKAR